jgi:hypothetical protein
MDFAHKIQVSLDGADNLIVRHTCGTTIEGAGKDNDEIVECHRNVPVGGKVAKEVKKLLTELLAVNKEAMETLCGRDTRLTAYVTTIRSSALKKVAVTGIDIDHNPEEEDGRHAEPGPEPAGDDGDGQQSGGDRPPRAGPVGHRRKPQ